MGQKVNPRGVRLGITSEYQACWYPESGHAFADILEGDLKARQYLERRLPEAAGVSGVTIERTGKNVRISIKTAKPGLVIGKKGEDIERLRSDISTVMGAPVQINIQEVRKPEIDALLVAKNIAQQLEKRIMFRRAMKRAMSSAFRAGAKGIKVTVSGRLGGAEIARSESYREGRVPLHTFRADIDYATAIAKTTYGIIGVKVWIFKGEVLVKPENSPSNEAA
ncbi:MAG: 30S ribosomal protein S3 [Gammaproteobacteria bacterium]